MNQLSNIIRIDEGGVSAPHIVYERFSQFAQPVVRDGLRLVREQQGGIAYLLLCERLKDAEWTDIAVDIPTDIPTEEVKESQ